jgi:hypothetical protein
LPLKKRTEYYAIDLINDHDTMSVRHHQGDNSMKKWIISVIAGIITNMSFASAGITHSHPQTINQKLSAPNLQAAACLIKITNDSNSDITVSGRFDDGSMMQPFMIFAYENPHFISLFYYNICHGVMNLQIDTTNGKRLYDQETYVNSRIRIKSGWFEPFIILENPIPVIQSKQQK